MRYENSSARTGQSRCRFQALVHATGYLMAYAVLQSLAQSVTAKTRLTARLSLAKVGDLLIRYRQNSADALLPKRRRTHPPRSNRPVGDRPGA